MLRRKLTNLTGVCLTVWYFPPVRRKLTSCRPSLTTRLCSTKKATLMPSLTACWRKWRWLLIVRTLLNCKVGSSADGFRSVWIWSPSTSKEAVITVKRKLEASFYTLYDSIISPFIGLGTYNDIREACGYGRAYDFSDLKDFFSYEGIALLQKLYKWVLIIQFWYLISSETGFCRLPGVWMTL